MGNSERGRLSHHRREILPRNSKRSKKIVTLTDYFELVLLACLKCRSLGFCVMFSNTQYLTHHDTNRPSVSQPFLLSKATVSFPDCNYYQASLS
jgi:hypothetical protein